MSIVYCNGWDWQPPNTSQSVIYQVGRKGSGYALSIDTTSGTIIYPFPSAVTGEVFITIWVYYRTNPSSGTNPLITIGGAGGTHMNMATNSTRILSMRTGSLSRASSTEAFPLQEWTRVDIRLVPGNSTDGSVYVYWNGVLAIEYTAGDTTTSASDMTTNYVQLHTYTGTSYYFDDLVVCDSTGTVNNGFIGADVEVLALMPSGAGDSAEFGSSTGDPNWENVSVSPQVIEEFNYSGTSGDLDRYAFGNLPPGYSDVKGVQVTALARGTKTTKSLKTSVKSGSSTSDGPTAAVDPAEWKTHVGMFENDPATTAAWTESAVNALNAGAEVV